MIRLGTTSFWIDPTATGWQLVQVAGGKKPVTRRWGPFTSPRHVMQQKLIELPKGAVRELKTLVEGMEAGDAARDDVPAPG